MEPKLTYTQKQMIAREHEREQHELEAQRIHEEEVKAFERKKQQQEQRLSQASRTSTGSTRPVADPNAFITDNDETTETWQRQMSPAERAKQLEMEMKEKERLRKMSGGMTEKMLKVGDKVVRMT
ncbi:hypothetical protein EC973_005143 [Apophysomyces ossiformis]|uniref:Uncharacterized protein n=1 Tax=Apophysomyces ossiformis TaxID=679940 RepID=A0A8H7BFG5_9FUNG|nr:hypothetical protein EC973_005143 [Apophysomyces ossiformis]